MPRIGIDLGTTNSLAAYWDGEKAVLIENSLHQYLTPSVVSVSKAGEIFVGEIAKQRLVSHPQQTAANFKRKMGSKAQIKLGKGHFSPEELSSFVLKQLKQDAEQQLGCSVDSAVISVPAYFNDAQRKATKIAGELAGLTVERLINEPTAAAIAYGIHEKYQESNIIVIDLGGGTFDVSVLELFEGVMEVHASAGDNYLGGEDFTKLLIKAFIKDNQLIESQLNAKQKGLMQRKIEQLKIQLSNAESANSIQYTESKIACVCLFWQCLWCYIW
ncbi:MAG: Hsp70 family protein [Enterobacterales bacterium]|nr:Hsp70 family protein [Enterobacterales bacterium]